MQVSCHTVRVKVLQFSNLLQQLHQGHVPNSIRAVGSRLLTAVTIYSWIAAISGICHKPQSWKIGWKFIKFQYFKYEYWNISKKLVAAKKYKSVFLLINKSTGEADGNVISL